MLRILTGLELSVREMQKQVALNTKLLQRGLRSGGNMDADYALPEGVVMPADNKEKPFVLEDAYKEIRSFQNYLEQSEEIPTQRMQQMLTYSTGSAATSRELRTEVGGRKNKQKSTKHPDSATVATDSE